ncbi:hypothetical protein ACIQOV_35545 [Kitasatospora sp. NPDC091257]|uniref:hypothetical protein n=1 Tax=Kitasatospora sp. NPDC091257 TaxID=3364084 RepID=UPI00382E53C4
MISAAIIAVVVRAAFWVRSRLRRRRAAEEPAVVEQAAEQAGTAGNAPGPGQAPERDGAPAGR